jgi:hypothetical protein
MMGATAVGAGDGATDSGATGGNVGRIVRLAGWGGWAGMMWDGIPMIVGVTVSTWWTLHPGRTTLLVAAEFWAFLQQLLQKYSMQPQLPCIDLVKHWSFTQSIFIGSLRRLRCWLEWSINSWLWNISFVPSGQNSYQECFSISELICWYVEQVQKCY